MALQFFDGGTGAVAEAQQWRSHVKSGAHFSPFALLPQPYVMLSPIDSNLNGVNDELVASKTASIVSGGE